ncbi:diamine N-acetyltransferase [Gordonia spumicola]|uniref:Diamine N-acetyltransferase n=1 Tax=Gordonia spumicola TaxID=589161 RepID=A0A7I9VA80_9ACTN|nr:GNAT family N-acetyltransferase [Gordonia spumicola]GEE02288.1 diamine N-acetyltransferase [Gordonia spumicola]
MAVTLRAQEVTDVEFLHSLFSDPEVVRYWFVEPYVTRTDFETKFEARRGDRTARRFIIDDDGEAVGIVELVDIRETHRNCEFQIIVAPGRQGHGYAQTATTLILDYAFKTLNLHKVYLQVDDENEGAIHVYRKCGFQVEGHQREEFWVDGGYHDATRMVVFASDPRPEA